MPLTQHQKKITFFSLLVILIIVGIAIFGKRGQPQPAVLEIWGFLDQPEVFAPLISDFHRLYPHISINYRLKDYQSYQNDLLQAFADDKAPDIFVVFGNWLPTYLNKISPLDLSKDKTLNLKYILENYPEIVSKETIINNQYLLGVPLSIDTLALFYNRDIFNYFNIALPPKTWEDLISLIPILRTTDQNNNLVRSAIALGTHNNVRWNTDILSALMMQFGSEIVDSENKKAIFDYKPQTGNTFKTFGEEALEFYLQFADPKNKNYTWNNNFPDSLLSFSRGRVAMTIGYAQTLDFLKEQNPQLNFGVSNLPNFSNSPYKINYGTTINLVVSNRSKNSQASWLFLKYLTQKEAAEKYFNLTKRPPSLRVLISQYSNDPTVGIFISQSLTAKSFYQFNFLKIKEIFEEMIYAASIKKMKPSEAVNNAVLKFNFEWGQISKNF